MDYFGKEYLYNYIIIEYNYRMDDERIMQNSVLTIVAMRLSQVKWAKRMQPGRQQLLFLQWCDNRKRSCVRLNVGLKEPVFGLNGISHVFKYDLANRVISFRLFWKFHIDPALAREFSSTVTDVLGFFFFRIGNSIFAIFNLEVLYGSKIWKRILLKSY